MSSATAIKVKKSAGTKRARPDAEERPEVEITMVPMKTPAELDRVIEAPVSELDSAVKAEVSDSDVEAPAAKKPKRVLATVKKVCDLDYNSEVTMLPVQIKNTKTAKLSLAEKTFVPVMVQLDAGGTCPVFAYEAGQFNTTLLINVTDDAEAAALMKISADLKAHMMAHKGDFFGEDIKDSSVEENMRTLVTKPAMKKKKTPDEKDAWWPLSLKCNADPGDLVSKDGKKPRLTIVDQDGNSVSPEDASNYNWSKAIFEIATVYSSGKNIMGISKRWRKLVLVPKREDVEVDFI